MILNGKSLGKKQSGKEVGFITKFEVEYQKGELIAVVYEKGKELSRTTLSTVDEERRLVLTREDINPLKELIYVNIDMVDSNNVLVNNCNNKISLLVEGAVEVLGFGSGNPKTNYNYNELTTELFLGQGTIILKAKGSGKVVVAVTDEVNKATETIEFVL